MRILSQLTLWILLFLLPAANAISAEVNCYSGKTRIYHGWGYNFVYNDDFLAFTEYKSEHLIIVSGECIVMVPINKGEKFNATNLRQESAYA